MAKKQKGPSSLCEWMIGTSIDSVIKQSRRSRAPKREVLRLEIATDDESGEDTVRLTYPRTGGGRRQRAPQLPVEEPAPAAEETEPATKKKVRFEEEVPRKSALKKKKKKKTTTTVVTEVSESEEEESEVDTDASSEMIRVEESSKARRRRKKQAANSETESESDSGPDPDCPCKDCVRERRALKKANEKAKSKKQQSSDKKGKKQKKAMMEDSSDESSDESSSDTEVETVKSKKQAKGGKSNDEKANKRDRKQKANAGTSNDKKSKKGNKNDQEANNQQAASGHGERNPASSGAAQNQIRMKAQGSYPEALPDMHPRRPNYIAPVRAEVVQTERVIETPYDPAPNAYFDDEHGVVRIYHGGAYGSNANHGLYPRRDKPFRPMPMGMPHPLQNPYLGGFNQPQGHHAGDENNHNIPVTQGMPINAWNAMYGPSGMPADPNFAYPGQNWPHQMHGYGMGKGHHPPSTHDKDKAGADNVMPPEIKPGGSKPPSKPASQRSAFTFHNIPHSQGSRQSNRGSTSGNDQGGGWGSSGGQDTSGSNQGQNTGWGDANAAANSTWGNDNTGQDGTNSAWGGNKSNNGTGWGDNNHGSQSGSRNNSTWGGDNNNNGGGGGAAWGTTENNGSTSGNQDDDNNNEGGAFAGTNGFDDLPSAMADNNIIPPMPGGWGDPTAAASTQGKADIDW